jgi:hypothetical protein
MYRYFNAGSGQTIGGSARIHRPTEHLRLQILLDGPEPGRGGETLAADTVLPLPPPPCLYSHTCFVCLYVTTVNLSIYWTAPRYIFRCGFI